MWLHESYWACKNCLTEHGNRDLRPKVLACAQVEEAITTSALLRLPQRMSRREKKQRVQDVIKQLVCLSVPSRMHFPNAVLLLL